MLRTFCPEDEAWLNEIVSKHLLENVYLYIDTQTYGFMSKDIMTWIASGDSGTKCILYQYYNSLQLLEVDSMDEGSLITEICDFIKNRNFSMISGEKTLTNRMYNHLKDRFQLENGFIFRFPQLQNEMSNQTMWANYEQCGEIAELICSDQSIGGHYSVPLLQSQLEDRMLNWGCRSRIIIKNKKIVSHMATYAESENIAVMAGLVTRKDERGNGLGRIVLSDLAQALLRENKMPILYCYKEPLWDWYKYLGWEKVQACAKLEKCDKK